MHERLIMAFIKTFFMNICIAISFLKIKGYKKLNKRNAITLILVNIIVGMLYAIIHENANIPIPHIFTNLICYTVYLLIVIVLIDEMDRRFFLVMLMAMCFSFTAFFLASSILFFITRLQLFKKIINSIIEFFMAGFFQIILIYFFFKIKRFKDGISFLKEEKNSKNINIISIILSIIIIISIVFTTSKYRFIDLSLLLAFPLGIVLIIYLIKKYITEYYKSKMKDKTVEILTEQIKEKDKIIDELSTELAATLKINHKYNYRISAAEKAISKLNFNEEFASENADIIELVNELSKNYKNELSLIEKQGILPKTEVFGIDNMLEYMNNEAKKNNISFEVEVNCNIKDIIENSIKQSKLETLLADHINDAIIAINYSGNQSRKIKISFNKVTDIHEIKIYDTGIDFEIETLLKLGTKQVTTHKDNGGSGIGFITTFETLKECKGSLIIEEYNNHTMKFTKSITIRFDNKNEYKIYSYRAKQIKEQDKENRIIVESYK